MDSPVPARWETIRAGLLTAHLSRAGGGVFTSVRQFARNLEAQPGIEVDVFGPSAAEACDWSPLSPRTTPTLGPRFFSYSPGLIGRLVHADLDLVHLHGLWMYTSAACLGFSRRTGKPHIISPHGMLDDWAVQNSAWKKRLVGALFEKENVQTAACMHALNSAEEQAIRGQGYTGPVAVVPNGIDFPPAGEPATADPWWVKSEPGIKTLLYLGRVHPKKGLPALLTAWSRLDPAKRKGWQIVIGGWSEGGHNLLLRRIAAALHIEGSITFAGGLFGEEKKAAFQHCDGFILPSLSEGQPMAILEAWTYGKPVIMTPQCNLPEGFEAGAALKIEPNPESIQQGLEDFLAMPPIKRDKLGANGRDLARERFGWKAIAAEMAAVYRWLAGRGTKPASVGVQ